ncbi:MAG: DUF4340 domain-containing protein, partial [Verrucomicrobiae bacterium]|nr:DUF4340 domain-containing protein [Verrucomicrobiae bacterium]
LPDAPDRPDVYVVDGNPHSLLDDPVLALRDPRLLPWQPDRVVQLTLKTARGEIEVRRKITPPVAGWTLVRPLQTRANTDLLERTLTSLATVRAESIEPAASPPGPPPNPVPDGHLVFELRSLGEENPLTVYLSPADGGKTDGTPGAGSKEPLLEAKIADRPAVFRLRSRLLAEMPESPNAFRDHSLARIPPALVFGIGIRSPDNPPVELKSTRTPDGVRWYSARNGEEEPANVARVARLIKAINEEPVVDFVSDSAARLEEFGLASPALQVAFNLFQIRPETAPDGAPAADAGKVGVEKKVLLLGSKDEYTLYANFVGEPYIYEINRSFSNYLPRHPLKWKDLRVLSFNPISLQYIERTRKGGPAIRLEYDYKRDTWTANEAGEDLTGLLDASAARQLRDTLGSLAAADWLTSLPIAYQALETPSVTFRIGVKSIDKATGDARVVTHELKFAPAGGELFYGQIDGAADAIFTLDSKTYRDLVQPLTQTRVAP